MSQLNLEGTLIEEDNDGKKVLDSRHRTPRRAIGLNFTDGEKLYATALSYWMKANLATPLIWLVVDTLADKGDGAIDFMRNISGEKFAQNLLEELRKE